MAKKRILQARSVSIKPNGGRIYVSSVLWQSNDKGPSSAFSVFLKASDKHPKKFSFIFKVFHLLSDRLTCNSTSIWDGFKMGSLLPLSCAQGVLKASTLKPIVIHALGADVNLFGTVLHVRFSETHAFRSCLSSNGVFHLSPPPWVDNWCDKIGDLFISLGERKWKVLLSSLFSSVVRRFVWNIPHFTGIFLFCFDAMRTLFFCFLSR